VIGRFPEGELVTRTLLRCRQMGLGFPDAWTLALHRAQRGRTPSNPHWVDAEMGLRFARSAFERAYEGRPVTRQDAVARALLHAMEAMYDDSEFAEPQFIALPEAA
jgi:hypothetical protein